MGHKCPAHLPKTALSKRFSFPHARAPLERQPGPFGLELAVTVKVHAIGHSAGSYGAMVPAVLKEPAFLQTLGSTKVTAIAMPESLLTRCHQRQVKLVHVEKDELCVWHPRIEDMQALEQNGIQVVYVEGATHWQLWPLYCRRIANRYA